MKHYSFVPILLCMFLFVPFLTKGQQLLIQQKSGQTHTELLSNVQNLHFNPGELVLQPRTGAMAAFALAEIQKIVFDTETGLSKPSLQSLVVSPSPVQSVLFMSGIPQFARKALVYKADGTLVMEREIGQPTHSLDVGSLSPGLYLLRVHQFTVKFVKR
ncbi:MAG: T9SS type A sorting domain-containing protein [Bacteroidales bacterium]|nr:T9SS type A sorting domain-containing protein [Bacteroidales bacterium]